MESTTQSPWQQDVLVWLAANLPSSLGQRRWLTAEQAGVLFTRITSSQTPLQVVLAEATLIVAPETLPQCVMPGCKARYSHTLDGQSYPDGSAGTGWVWVPGEDEDPDLSAHEHHTAGDIEAKKFAELEKWLEANHFHNVGYAWQAAGVRFVRVQLWTEAPGLWVKVAQFDPAEHRGHSGNDDEYWSAVFTTYTPMSVVMGIVQAMLGTG